MVRKANRWGALLGQLSCEICFLESVILRRDGWGTSVMMLTDERGDPRRMFIGGVGALYRVFKYSGQWSDGVRQVKDG